MALIQSSLADGVGTIALDNYAHRNALSGALIAEAIATLIDMRADARVVVLRAASKNKVWSAGHDLRELSPKGQDPLAWRDPLEQLLRAVGDFPGPVIAMIDGSVWGGACDLALDCDITLGDADASFAFVPAKLGLPYNLSGVQRFLARLPPNVAIEMAATADPVDAERALRVNLLNHLHPAAGSRPGHTPWRRRSQGATARPSPLSRRRPASCSARPRSARSAPNIWKDCAGRSTPQLRPCLSRRPRNDWGLRGRFTQPLILSAPGLGPRLRRLESRPVSAAGRSREIRRSRAGGRSFQRCATRPSPLPRRPAVRLKSDTATMSCQIDRDVPTMFSHDRSRSSPLVRMSRRC